MFLQSPALTVCLYNWSVVCCYEANCFKPQLQMKVLIWWLFGFSKNWYFSRFYHNISQVIFSVFLCSLILFQLSVDCVLNYEKFFEVSAAAFSVLIKLYCILNIIAKRGVLVRGVLYNASSTF